LPQSSATLAGLEFLDSGQGLPADLQQRSS